MVTSYVVGSRLKAAGWGRALQVDLTLLVMFQLLTLNGVHFVVMIYNLYFICYFAQIKYQIITILKRFLLCRNRFLNRLHK